MIRVQHPNETQFSSTSELVTFSNFMSVCHYMGPCVTRHFLITLIGPEDSARRGGAKLGVINFKTTPMHGAGRE